MASLYNQRVRAAPAALRWAIINQPSPILPFTSLVWMESLP